MAVGMPIGPFDVAGKTLKLSGQPAGAELLESWWQRLLTEGQARKAREARERALGPAELEALAGAVFREVSQCALEAGARLPEAYQLRLVGELSGLGPLLELVAGEEVEDIAINLQTIYLYTTREGWQRYGPAPEHLGDALRVMIDRAGQRAPTPDYPIADAMLQVMVPTGGGGVQRKGVRINYIMPPASPYGDIITLRVSRYRTPGDAGEGLGALCQRRLPAVGRPAFTPRAFPGGRGVLSAEAANYLLAVMVLGGTLVVAGATGSGKTYLAQRVLQEMLDFYPSGALRLFVIEDSNEIVLNGWNGDRGCDTGNVLYTVTRAETRGGPPPVLMYDLIRAALRSRPHGVIVGEARGAEAWELVRASATGHGYSAFTLHATSAEHVWARFLQVVQAHPDVQKMSDLQIAQSFAEAISAVVYIERSPLYGQVVREVVEVSPVVEKSAARPAFTPLFRFDPRSDQLLPTGNRPARPGFQLADLGLAEAAFARRG